MTRVETLEKSGPAERDGADEVHQMALHRHLVDPEHDLWKWETAEH